MTCLSLASMEPPPFGSGNPSKMESNGSLCSRSSFRASMEPPPFGSGNWRCRDLLGEASRKGLQWSHRLSAVETGLDGTAPPCATRSPLQWSHRLSAVETLHAKVEGVLVSRCAIDILQWSHRLSAVENWGPQTSPSTDPIRLASMEPPPFGSGKQREFEGWCSSPGCKLASMEPPPFGSGNSCSASPR